MKYRYIKKKENSPSHSLCFFSLLSSYRYLSLTFTSYIFIAYLPFNLCMSFWYSCSISATPLILQSLCLIHFCFSSTWPVLAHACSFFLGLSARHKASLIPISWLSSLIFLPQGTHSTYANTTWFISDSWKTEVKYFVCLYFYLGNILSKSFQFLLFVFLVWIHLISPNI